MHFSQVNKSNNLQVKGKTTTKQQGFLHASPPQPDPPQDDGWQPRRISLTQTGRHLRYPKGRDWCHQQRARRFLRSRRVGLKSEPGPRWKRVKGLDQGTMI